MCPSPEQARPGGWSVFGFWITVGVVAVAFALAEHEFRASEYAAAAEGEEGTEPQDLAADVDEGRPTRRIGFALFGLLGTVLLLLPSTRSDAASTGVMLTYLLVAAWLWCLASVFWSDDPGMTWRRLVVLNLCLLGALGINKHLSAERLCWLVLLVIAGYLVLGVAAELRLGTLRPGTAGYRFAGTLHPNAQGVQCGILCLAAVCAARGSSRGKKWLFCLAAISCGLLLLTRSRTAMFSLLAALAVYLLATAPPRTRLLKVAAAGFLVSTLLFVSVLGEGSAARTLEAMLLLGRGEEVANLTGRVPLWIELGHQIRQCPWLGFGYGAFWNVQRIEEISWRQEWQISEAHSAYIETVLHVGLIGACLLTVAVCWASLRLWWAYQSTRRSGYLFLGALLAFGMVCSLTEGIVPMPSFVSVLAVSAVLQAVRSGPSAVATGGPQPPWSKSPLTARKGRRTTETDSVGVNSDRFRRISS